MGGVPFDPNDADSVLVRRLKDDLRRLGEEFPERVVQPLTIPGGSLPAEAPELKLPRLLQSSCGQRQERLMQEGASKRQRNADRLVTTNLQKRLLSFIEAFARTLKMHCKTMEHRQQRQEALAAAGTPLDLLQGGADWDSDSTRLSEDELLTLEEAQTSAALQQTVDANQSDLALLEAMGKITEANDHCQDLRIHKLAAFLRQHFCSNPGKAQARREPTRLLIFTQLRRHQALLGASIAGTPG